MLKQEWKSLLHNKLLLLVVVAIILIPVIYAGLFLKSMWDPYGSVSNLPVAVVNNDQPVEYEGTTLQIGADMVDELKDNDSMAFNFVDAETAEAGLRNGTYYMVITIPEDFSKNASTLMDENPQKMELNYETNPGTNYIASKMSETALAKIKNTVANQVTEVYTQTVFDQIATAGDGMQEAADGSGQLYDGSKELGDGLTKLKDGSSELAESLSDGAEQIKEVSASGDTVSMFASPVEDKETQATTVENNGHAMAPYMMSVGLWVGCLAFCLMYPLTTYNGKLKSGFAWWASKASVLYLVAVLQGISLILLLRRADGFEPAEFQKTVLFACLTAVAFTSIMYFFNITLGKVGSFLMLVFMVVQLAGSAGTYPVELSPEFVSKIHAYLPFTYTVNAFRSTIAGGESIRISVIVLCGVAVVFTILTIIAFQIKAHLRREEKKDLYDYLEEHGLA